MNSFHCLHKNRPEKAQQVGSLYALLIERRNIREKLTCMADALQCTHQDTEGLRQAKQEAEPLLQRLAQLKEQTDSLMSPR
jgi:hypothetical protein